jgi:hypothetical protein
MIKLNYLEVKNILEKYPQSKITKWRKNNYCPFYDAIEIPANPDDPFDTPSVYPIRKDVVKLLAIDK